MDAARGQAQYYRVRLGLAASLLPFLAINSQAQPSAEDERLRAAELAALDALCAHARPSDGLAPTCKLYADAWAEAERLTEAAAHARAQGNEALAEALTAGAEAAARPRPEALAAARGRAIAPARAGAEQEPPWTTPRTPNPPPYPDRNLVLIAPPGFGPDPAAPLK